MQCGWGDSARKTADLIPSVNGYGREMPDVTQLLSAIDAGDPRAGEQLLPLVYEELRKLAAAKMAQEMPGQTLQATALVHEAWLRLGGMETPQAWNGRGHFFGAAAEAMRRILVDRARKKGRIRHGGALERVDLENVTLATEDNDDTVLAIHEALEKLALESPQKAEIVKLRYFTGMENQEVARALGISLTSVERSWAYARSWLHRELKKIFSNG
jgi:RNA polymerase sigma factor (TIGR02999 family)